MEYVSSTWDPHTQRNINKLEMEQRRTARFVKGDHDRTSSVTSMLADLKWNTLQERRLQSKSDVLQDRASAGSYPSNSLPYPS